MATKKKAAKPAHHSPLLRVKEEHGGKEKLVDRLLGLVDHGADDKETVKGRLLAVSNTKLLRMLAVAGEVKEKYGSPEGMADAAAKVLGHAKDKAYLERLGKMAKETPARVLDLIKTAAKHKAA